MNCRVAGCAKPVKIRSERLCGGHYHRLKRYGYPEYAPPSRAISICSVDGCESPVAGNMMCTKHYQRFRKYGDPIAGGIDYGSAKQFVIDLIDSDPTSECITWPYGKNSNGYGRINWNGTPSNVHAIVTELKHGPKPTQKHESCHKCGNGHLSCVNPEHLYWGTRRDNVRDMMRHGSDRFWGRDSVAANDNEPRRAVA